MLATRGTFASFLFEPRSYPKAIRPNIKASLSRDNHVVVARLIYKKDLICYE